MGLDWSKRRRQSNSARGTDPDAALARLASEPATPQPSKAALRAESADAIERYTGRVQLCPTIIELKCVGCNHRGRVKVWRGERKRFRCSKCGYLSM